MEQDIETRQGEGQRPSEVAAPYPAAEHETRVERAEAEVERLTRECERLRADAAAGEIQRQYMKAECVEFRARADKTQGEVDAR